MVEVGFPWRGGYPVRQREDKDRTKKAILPRGVTAKVSRYSRQSQSKLLWSGEVTAKGSRDSRQSQSKQFLPGGLAAKRKQVIKTKPEKVVWPGGLALWLPGRSVIGLPWLAAKIYRPRMFRNLRNDKMYREGRTILTAEGRPVKNNDHRTMRAIGKKSAFGVQVEHTSWLMHEYTTLARLYRAGAAVPQPIAAAENAILMGYFGDSQRAAPTLNEVSLDSTEASHLFEQILGTVELMLQQELIHGDLSAYNILYWAGSITLIDFPQVVSCYGNRNAYVIFQRDIQRVCDYFARQGVHSDAETIATALWQRHVGNEIRES